MLHQNPNEALSQIYSPPVLFEFHALQLKKGTRQTPKQLEFNHLVVDRTGLIFASARDEESNVSNYLVDSHSGEVKKQVGNQFEPISEEYADEVRRQIRRSYGSLPVYRVPSISLS